ncbi:coiled-coil domain-containing protein 73 isoform X2 [Oryzias latipes]|uniref:coiled-coil domain-containing protein 73 isoform X2 n=1 Tax=Oryzias latipes TaxID=8090 RepID=UPI0009D96D62|nr:coiled-coil domain-containing protein 73 isoform X2 [Oryzias latipes]
MEGSADSGTPPTHIAFSGPASEPELSWSSSHSQTESEGTILLQLLEFKTHLLEVVEELHIRRDAEARFEDQTSKLVLEKQELEWEKESLQHQNETVTKQHAELLTAAKKEFQAKLRHIEEEKGKHQANAELKEKEINNLKEELKSLQVKLLKYNLEKKSSELEQKLALQSRTKDSHLNQLGEVEKRFSALSKQCAMVKKAHEQLQQNADEAMRINRKLTFANQKQEATIMSLKKELDEVNNKLIKVKMTSVRYEKTHSQAEGQQQVQELQQRLIMEKDINRKLEKENLAERAEKQEMLRSLQRTQELLLRQTQTVRRVEMELKTQTERFQALQHKHEVMREQSKAMQDRLAQLSESFTASKSRWDKEKDMFLDQIKNEQEDRQSVEKAHEVLQQKHSELSKKAKCLVHRTDKEELFSAEVEGKGEIPVECIHSSERPDCSLQDLMSSQANEGNQKETEAASAADAGTTTEMTDKHPHSQPATTIDDRLLQSDDPVPSRETRTTNSIINSFEAGEQNPSSNLIPNDPSDAAALQSNVNIQTASSRKCESPDKLAHLQTNEEHDKELEENEEKPNKQEGCSLDHQDGEDIRDEDVKNESGVEKIRDKEAIEPQGHRNLETQGNDQPDGDTMNEVEWRGQTAQHAPDQKMVAQAGTDVTEDTVPLQVNEPMAEEPPRCELSEAPSQKVTDNDFCHFNEEHQADPEDGLLSSEEPQPLGHDAVQTSCENSPSLHNQSVCQESDQPANENPQRKATDFPTECQDISTYSHLNVTPLSAHFPIETRRTEAGDFSDTDSIVKHVDEAQVHQKSESVKINPSKAELQSPSEDADQRKGHFNVKACENSTCTTVSTSVRTCWLTEEAAYHDPEAQTGRYEKQMSNDTPKDAAEKETHPKVSIHSSHESNNSLKISESSVAGMKNYNSLFDWNKARIKTLGSREKPDLHHLRQGGFFSGLNSVGSDEIQARQPVSASLFIKNRQSKVPLVMMRASDLLSASSGSADAATSRKRHEREWEAKGRICSESPAGETKSTASISRLQDVSGSVGKLPLQNVPECSRASTSASGLISGPKSNPSFSLEMENQQTLFREQVSKIERFLNAERLRTSKRQRTDN